MVWWLDERRRRFVSCGGALTFNCVESPTGKVLHVVRLRIEPVNFTMFAHRFRSIIVPPSVPIKFSLVSRPDPGSLHDRYHELFEISHNEDHRHLSKNRRSFISDEDP